MARTGRLDNMRQLLRGALYLLSIGLAVHLVLPQVSGLERSAKLIAEASPFLIGAAFLAELLSASCYAELLGRSVGRASGMGNSMRFRRRRGLGRWFMLRLTISEAGASHVLPGGGLSMAAVTYSALRTRGFEPVKIGRALAVVSALVYSSLGVIFAGSLVYVLLNRDLGAVASIATILGLTVTLAAFVGSYAAYRRPQLARQALARILRLIGTVFRRDWSRQEAEGISKKFVAHLGDELRTTSRQLLVHPAEAVRLSALAFGYWIFDFICLFLVFEALGVPAGIVGLIVSYGISTAAGTMPLTPGGVGVFETTMLATLALLGFGAAAAIPILGYRLFNFWLPIPLAAILYPTLRGRSTKPKQKPG